MTPLILQRFLFYGDVSSNVIQRTELMNKMRVVRYAISPHEINGDGLPFEQRGHLVFVGNGVNPTNQLALRNFLRDCFSTIKIALPDVKLVIIGALICC